MSKTLAQRNNNPLNIRYSSCNKWEGQIGSEGGFCKFSDEESGIRAAIIILLKYWDCYGLDTIEKIVTRWAPPSENDTVAYISHVCNWACMTELQKISTPHQFVLIIQAMSFFEGYGVGVKTEVVYRVLAQILYLGPWSAARRISKLYGLWPYCKESQEKPKK